MNFAYRTRPGLGFIFAVIATLASATFFAWGWGTPPLDKVWQMQLELQLGSRAALSGSEQELLQETLERYPALAKSMLDDAPSGLISAHTSGLVDLGYALVLRRMPSAPGELRVSSPTGARLALVVRTASAQRLGVASGDKPFVWDLPNGGPFPQLVDVRLVSDKKMGGRNDEGDEVLPMLIELHTAP